MKCELIVNSDAEHLQQVYTGFSVLHQKGFLELKQTIPDVSLHNRRDPDRWRDYRFSNTHAILNQQISVYYDAHDWSWIDEDILREADFYFKRSFDGALVARLKESDKVFPLGLSYLVTNRTLDVFQLQRAAFYSGIDKLRVVAKGCYKGKRGETENLDRLESYPNFEASPRVLFMARAWDPGPTKDQDQRETIEHLNHMRAACVRQLRKEFGQRFFGGLAHSAYSEKHFKDCLLPSAKLADKRHYLETLVDFPICVATVGLNGSNGWKLGEYVAFSRAIVTEPLQFQVSGDFAETKNYLRFTSPEELLESVTRLVRDADLRREMMMNNFRYYHGYVRPDALILNSLSVVLGHTDAWR